MSSISLTSLFGSFVGERDRVVPVEVSVLTSYPHHWRNAFFLLWGPMILRGFMSSIWFRQSDLTSGKSKDKVQSRIGRVYIFISLYLSSWMSVPSPSTLILPCVKKVRNQLKIIEVIYMILTYKTWFTLIHKGLGRNNRWVVKGTLSVKRKFGDKGITLCPYYHCYFYSKTHRYCSLHRYEHLYETIY